MISKISTNYRIAASQGVVISRILLLAEVLKRLTLIATYNAAVSNTVTLAMIEVECSVDTGNPIELCGGNLYI